MEGEEGKKGQRRKGTRENLGCVHGASREAGKSLSIPMATKARCRNRNRIPLDIAATNDFFIEQIRSSGFSRNFYSSDIFIMDGGMYDKLSWKKI